MDMWPAYINSVHAHLRRRGQDRLRPLPHHQHMGEAVDTVRKREHKELHAEGIDT